MKKPWKLISNASGIDEDYKSLDEALKAAEETLELWRQQARDDGEWDEDVEGVEIHLVTHAARITMRDGDNEDDGVDYGITEILDNEIDEELRKLRNRTKALEVTISTFLHDLDAHEELVNPSEIRMNSAMWMQVQAFRNLLNNQPT